MNTLLSPGQERHMNIRRAPRNGEPGAIVFVLLVTLFHDGVSLVFNHHDVLNRQFGNLDEARAYLQFLKDEAAKDTDVAILIELAGMWTSAMAVADQAERDMLDGITANLDATNARLDTVVDVTDIVADTKRTGGWNGLRQQYRQVRPTRTQTHAKPLTRAQLDRMRQHHNGVVTCGDGQPWTLLDGIVQRGYADRASIVYWPGTRKIRSVRLNGRGWAAIGQAQEVAA